MRIIVSDSSCLIDLQKCGLLRAIFELPHSFAVPQPLFDEELLSISDAEKTAMLELGMEKVVLPGEQVLKAAAYSNENRRLKLNDCFALVVAEEIEGAILFTGDAPLKKLAVEKQIEAHGVIWAIDQLEEHTDTPGWLLLEALEKLYNDPLVFLPDNMLEERIRSYKRKLSK